ncbi:hypothetical protein BpHYR1_045686 [Brachionus plicatilis]|uniref:Uncharacterized protein n=1 Tax=Brachionus plicatilis TaxID=10195 RepID=A0A3M7QH64_BRAPC|nr:hypothetical protein BpHYR1_045686 [Brachionus plicatilis]
MEISFKIKFEKLDQKFKTKFHQEKNLKLYQKTANQQTIYLLLLRLFYRLVIKIVSYEDPKAWLSKNL